MTTDNYEHYFMVRATITDGVVSFALDSSVYNLTYDKPLWNDTTGTWHKVLDTPTSVQDDDERAYALLFDRLLSKYNNTYLGDK